MCQHSKSQYYYDNEVPTIIIPDSFFATMFIANSMVTKQLSIHLILKFLGPKQPQITLILFCNQIFS